MCTTGFIYFLAGAILAALLVWWVFARMAHKSEHASDPEQDALNLIMTRASVRTYEDRPVEPQKVELLLRAAMAAPSAINQQPWAFIVIDDKELLRKLADALPYAKMAAKAPLAIVVCGDLPRNADSENAWWVLDGSNASENILLAAHALGLGAVWTAVYPIDDRVASVQQILNLPPEIVPLNLIPIGYPASNPAPKQNWKPENVHRNGWK